MLVDTKIGKRLSAVEEKGEIADTVEQIKELKEKLKKRWTEVYKKTKKEADAPKVDEKTGQIKLPYLGEKGRKAFETGNQSRDFRIERLIVKLQTPTDTDKDGKSVNYPTQFLLHALEVAKELEKAIEDCFKSDEKAKSDKFRQLISVFNEQGHFRTMLLNGDITSEEIVRMKKEGFMSA